MRYQIEDIENMYNTILRKVENEDGWYIVTFTFDPKKKNLKQQFDYVKDMKFLIQELGGNLFHEWYMVVEAHKSGSPHLHGVLKTNFEIEKMGNISVSGYESNMPIIESIRLKMYRTLGRFQLQRYLKSSEIPIHIQQQRQSNWIEYMLKDMNATNEKFHGYYNIIQSSHKSGPTFL